MQPAFRLPHTMNGVADAFSAMASGAALRSALARAASVPLIVAVAVLPSWLALERSVNAYSHSFAHALSVTTIGITLLLPLPLTFIEASSFLNPPPQLAAKAHATLLALYGLRLARHLHVLYKRWREKHTPETPPYCRSRLRRSLAVLGSTLFNALLCAPAIFHRVTAATTRVVWTTTWVGLALSAAGLLFEARADAHKLATKAMAEAALDADAPVMNGPYSHVRHASFTGQGTFWIGSFLAGLHASLDATTPAGVLCRLGCGLAGLGAVLTYLLQASKRLDAKEMARYGMVEHPHHELYLAYRARVCRLVPMPRFGGARLATKA